MKLINYCAIKYKERTNPAGTRRPGDVSRRSPKGPNVQDLQGTFRGLLGDQQKN